MTTKKRRILKFIKDTLLVIAGTAILAFGTGLFLTPNNLVTGGVSGIGIIIENFTNGPISLGWFSLTAEIYASVLAWLLFAVGFVFLGKHFALQTLVSTIVYPLFLNLGALLADSGIMGGFFDLTSAMYTDTFGVGVSVLISALFGGVMVGAGSALTFLGGGSTGGSDIIPLVICRFFPKLKPSVMIFITDGTIVLLGIFAVKNLMMMLFGIIAAFVCAVVVDKLFLSDSNAFIAHVISSKYEEINRQIINRMHRTTTITDAVGGFTGEGRKMIMVTFSIRQYNLFASIVSVLDKDAFITVHRAHQIAGDGWTYNLEEFDPLITDNPLEPERILTPTPEPHAADGADAHTESTEEK